MTNTGQKKKGIPLRPHVLQEKTWLFLAVMKFIGKPDGKIVWMEQTLLFVQWFVIRRVHYLLPEKMPAAGNVIPAPNGQVCGGTDAAFQPETHASLKTL